MIQEIFEINIGEPLSCLDVSKEYITVGTLDENVLIFQQPYSVGQKQYAKLGHHLIGVIDTCINHTETQVAVSSLDSCIKIWDIDDRKLVSQIQCDPYSCWKVQYLDSQTIVTAGELGYVYLYHVDTKERLQRIETDMVYYAQSLEIKHRLIAVGNEGGGLHLINEQGKKESCKPHYKAIKSLQFVDTNHILTGSEDGLIRLVDLQKMEVVTTFRGHKYGVSNISMIDNKTFVSAASDRSIRMWNLDQIYSTKQYQAGNNKPGGISGLGVFKNSIVAAHDCGLLAFYE